MDFKIVSETLLVHRVTVPLKSKPGEAAAALEAAGVCIEPLKAIRNLLQDPTAPSRWRVAQRGEALFCVVEGVKKMVTPT